MKRSILCAILALGVAALRADDAKFSQTLSPADFAAAGLGKLSPEELARLDLLVQQRENGAKAAQAAAEAKAAQAEANAKAARAAQAAAEKKARGLLSKAAALLPGSKVEYRPLESRIVGKVHGWEPGTVFTLENGQRWRVEKYADSYYGDAATNPKVTIFASSLGGFKMEIQGFPVVRVRPADQ